MLFIIRMRFASSDARNQLEEKLANMSLENMQRCRAGAVKEVQMMNVVIYKRGNTSSVRWVVLRGFFNFETDQLCYPCNSNFPFADISLKRASDDNEQELVLFQVTGQKQKNKIFKRSAMVKFFEKIADVTSLKEVKLRMVLIPHPEFCSSLTRLR